MDERQQKDDAIASLAEANRLPSETIWCILADESGAAHIRFIETSMVDHANRMTEIGLGGGEGRAITCRKANGIWSITGSGRWIG